MHTILFDSYRKYQKVNKYKFIKAIFKLPVGAQFLLCGLAFCLIYSIFACFIDFFKDTYYICLISQVILCVWLYFYTENFQINNSDIRLSLYGEYCDRIKQWLIEIGIVTTKENIKELMARIEREIEKQENQRKIRGERIVKWIQILIIPILLAVFFAIIKEQENLTVLFAYLIVFIGFIVSLGLVFFSCYNLFDFFKKQKTEQLKSLYNDLQGVIDCCFDNNMLLKDVDNKEDKDIFND